MSLAFRGPAERRPLLAREQQLGRIATAMAGARSGEPALVIVEAGAGLGKTALLAVARRAAADAGVRVLAARADSHESAFAYGVVRQLLAPPLVAASPDERAALLAGPAAGSAPALGDASGDAPPFDASLGVVDGLYWLTVNMAALGPLALFIDDGHWADASSLRFLAHLLRRIDGLPIAVVLALRSSEPGAPEALLDALRMDPLAEHMSLMPLGEADIAAMVRELVEIPVGDEFCRACHHASAGNPLYLLDLIRALDRAELLSGHEAVERVARVWPASVARHVLRRVAAIGPDAIALARAMAVLGDGGAPAHAARMAGLDDARTYAAARALREIDILADQSPIRFAHPVVRLALQSDLAPHVRNSLLESAADLLSADDAPPEQVAGYLLQLAPGSGRPIEPLRRAAAVARARGAPDAAVTYLQRALAEPPPAAHRVTVLRELGQAEAMVTSAASIEHFTAALEHASDPAQRLGLILELANALAMLGRASEAVAAIESELAGCEALSDAVREQLEAHLCAFAFWGTEDNERVRSLLRRFADDPPGDPATARLALAVRATRCEVSAQHDAAAALAALAGDALTTAPWIGSMLAIATLIACEHFDAAGGYLEQALVLARMSGDSRVIGNVLALRATLSYATGDLSAAEIDSRTHAGPLRGGMRWAGIGYTISVLLRSLVRRGALEDAEQLLAEGEAEPWAQTTNLQFFLRSARGELRYAQGRFHDAAADFATARKVLGGFTSFAGAGPALYGDLEPLALARIGRCEEADVMVEEGIARARAYGAPRNLATTLRLKALLADDDESVELAREAVELLEGTGARLDLAQARVDLGMLMRHGGQRVQARAHLSAGGDLARKCGAVPLADRARDELLATGARPRRDRVTGRDALTPSERRLAHLAAQGKTNREIAQELYLSQKTVEMHLGRAYRKLGIAGRAELRGALGG